MYPRKLYSAWGLWIVWALQLVFITKGLVLLILYTLDIVSYPTTQSGTKSVLAFLLALQFLTLVWCPLEIVLWSYHMLDPWLYFTFQLLGSLYWTIYTGLAYRIAPSYLTQYGLSVKITILTLIPFTCLSLFAGLGYSIIVLVKMRKSGGRYGKVEEWRTSEKPSGHNYERALAAGRYTGDPRYA